MMFHRNSMVETLFTTPPCKGGVDTLTLDISLRMFYTLQFVIM